MTAYNFTPTHTLSPDVAARKAARKKVIERAQQLEQESYKAMMRKRRMLQGATTLDTIAWRMNNDELLEKIGKQLDARFEAEREHTRKMVREEVAVEGERTKRADASLFIHVDERFDSIEDRIKGVEISNKRLENDLQEVKQGQKQLEQDLVQTNKAVLQIKTVVELTAETVNTMDEGLTEVVKDHRERLKRLEEQASTLSHKCF
jgi:hypothetical protein